MVVRHVSYFWKVLERCFPPEVKDSVKGMRMSKDEKGVVFDLPSDLSSVVKVRGMEGGGEGEGQMGKKKRRGGVEVGRGRREGRKGKGGILILSRAS